jgi:hypothetical protein
MTDEVTHRLVSNNRAPISVSCTNNDAEIIVLESDLLLGTGLGRVLFRYDNDQPLEIDADTAKNVAIVRRDAGADWKSGDPARTLNSETAFIWLREPHERLRVRLTGFDQQTRDLAFSAHGLAASLRALEKRCGMDKDGNWPRKL